ncbi:MAG: hypothetical protein HY650_07560 [Acidobacteria bacterium]|nr:hypothetical protein [Acidobacteriota bacterium]
MFRRKLLFSLALVALAPMMMPQSTQAQTPFTFEGKWNLSLNLAPGPVLTYQLEATPASVVLLNNGGGLATRTADLMLPVEARRIYGIAWRNQLDATNNVIGFSLCLEIYSTRAGSATTFLIKGGTGTEITGITQGIDENKDAAAAAYDPKFGLGVSSFPYTLTRVVP